MGQNSGNSVWTDTALGTPNSLLGSPLYESSAMTATVTTGSNILLAGDFKAGYYIYDRVGVEMRYLPVVTGSNQRPTGQAGWFAFFRTGAKVVDPNAFRVLKL
jgi:HK97 family phage major capsid protein